MVAREKLQDERGVAFIDVGVSPKRGVGCDEVAARIYRYPEVISAHLASGGCHLRVIVEGESIRHVAAFVTEKLVPIDHVTVTNTHFLLKRDLVLSLQASAVLRGGVLLRAGREGLVRRSIRAAWRDRKGVAVRRESRV